MPALLHAPGVLDVVNFEFIPFGNAYFEVAGCPKASHYVHDTRICWNERCNGTAASANADIVVALEKNRTDYNPPPADCFAGTLICQHGEPECAANRLEACAISHYGDNVTKYLGFIDCYEGENEPSPSTAESCARTTGIDYTAITTCAMGEEGLALDAKNARATADLPGGHTATPWPMLNGQALDSQDNLLQAICAAWTGPAPAGCN